MRHCDAGGTSPGSAQEEAQGGTFLRGIQRTNPMGAATFATIYPGSMLYLARRGKGHVARIGMKDNRS